MSPKESSLAYEEQHNAYETAQTLSQTEWSLFETHKCAHDKIAFLSDYTAQEVVKITGTITVSF